MAAPWKHPRVTVALGVVAVALAPVVSACSSDDQTPAGAQPQPGVTCTEDPGLSVAVADDDIRLAPFSAESPWNQTFDGQIPFGAESSQKTVAFREGVGDPSSPVHAWINAERYSLPIVQASDCDPVVSLDTDSTNVDLRSMELRVPTDVEPSEGTDRNLLVIQPDHRTMVEMWTAERLSDDEWTAGSIEIIDLESNGIGPFNGVRAFGGSAIGGLIRKWEVDPTDPNYRDGVIRHGLAIAVPGSFLRFDGGPPGYDAAGYGTSTGYVYPATEQDYDAEWNYGGPIPMGSRVVLPPSVDLASLDLPPELLPVARALQEYGGYVVDRVGDGTVAFYAEPNAPRAWLDAARGPSNNAQALDRIRGALVVMP